MGRPQEDNDFQNVFLGKALGKAAGMGKFTACMFEPIKVQLEGAAEKMSRLRRFL
jgi:hypothetical protein